MEIYLRKYNGKQRFRRHNDWVSARCSLKNTYHDPTIASIVGGLFLQCVAGENPPLGIKLCALCVWSSVREGLFRTATQQLDCYPQITRNIFFSYGSHNKPKPANMPVSRMRMRPWLERMINSDTIEGLTWLDPEKTMFSIPWKHAARHGWAIEKDANLFKMWAIHTGKYVEGRTSDPKTWKANFRCAMNSLPDIEEVKKMSINKGHQAVRVFKMLPAATKSKDKRSKAKEARSRRKSANVKVAEEMVDSSDTQSSVNESTTDSFSPQHSNVNTSQQELRFEFQDEVPDFSMSVEVGAFDMCHRFEVSPEHITEYDADIIQICKQLEEDSLTQNSSYGSGFLTNEACTSPGSQWSEPSSGEDLDDIPEYTILGADFWATLNSQFS